MIPRKVTPAQVEATLAGLPPSFARNRILSAAEAARYWGVSLPHWRRMGRDGKVPKSIRISERRIGWRVGELAAALDARDEVRAPM